MAARFARWERRHATQAIKFRRQRGLEPGGHPRDAGWDRAAFGSRRAQLCGRGRHLPGCRDRTCGRKAASPGPATPFAGLAWLPVRWISRRLNAAQRLDSADQRDNAGPTGCGSPPANLGYCWGDGSCWHQAGCADPGRTRIKPVPALAPAARGVAGTRRPDDSRRQLMRRAGTSPLFGGGHLNQVLLSRSLCAAYSNT